MKIPPTKHTLLRPWRLADAPALFSYAKDPLMGPLAGWAPHQNTTQSRNTISSLFKQTLTFAITQGPKTEPIGSLSLKIGSQSQFCSNELQAEIGYWIGRPYWGKGLVVEATQALLRVCFEQNNMQEIWCCYFQENKASKRVSEKLGFSYVQTLENQYFPLIDQYKTLVVTRITLEQWQKQF